MTRNTDSTRITAVPTEIDDDAVLEFFEGRGRSFNPDHPLTSVLYQDNDPELAAARDAHEKSVALPLWQLTQGLRVLDVGCGIGRWADPVLQAGATYVGVDFSESLLEIARRSHPSARFVHGSMTRLDQLHLPLGARFDRIVMAGVLIYVNDADAVATLAAVANCAADGARVYLREPVAVAHRLTLHGHWSTDLGTEYSAIYRTDAQLRTMLDNTLGAAGFRCTHDADLYPPVLNNRAETRQRYYLLEQA